MIERVPRECAELRIDLSRDALKHVCWAVEQWLKNYNKQGQIRVELENLRNVTRNLGYRFDEKLTE